MQKINSVIFFIILSVNAYSQKGFYLHPVIENKSHTNKDYPSELITDQGNKFQINPINFYNDFSRVGFGIHAGYRTKKMFYEIGWCTDRALAASRITTLCMANDSTYFMDEVRNTISIPLNKFPIRVGAKIAGKDSVTKGKNIRWQLFIYAGIDILRISTSAAKPLYRHDFMIALNQYVQYEHTSPFLSYVGSYAKTLGFLLKAHNRKGKNIFNMGIHYSLGRYTLLYDARKFTNYDGTVYWGGGTWSKASGLYISISKDIYPKNIIKGVKLPTLFQTSKP